MSKKVLAIALIVVAIAAPYAIPEILGVAAGSFAAIATTVVVEAGLALAQSSLMGPGKIKGLNDTNPRERLFVTFDTSAPRKWAFGYTALATDMRYQAYSGAEQDTYHQVIAVASHAVQSIEQIWLDNELAWTSSGGPQGRYVGYLTVTPRLEGNAGNAVAIDGLWTSSCRLTGCAYVVLQYKLTGTSSKVQSPFSGGVSSRMTIRGKGGRVYDPRLDSTVLGGSGSQRAADQSTWAWNDSASRNPALQLLFYLLGWRINGKLAVGMGLPAARLDLASFMTAANVCDESVTLAAGGTEPRYRLDGVLSEADDRDAVIDTLCSQMNATLRDAGGKIALTVIKNDLAAPVASFTEGDILGDEEWNQTPEVSRCFNIVRGRRIDASDSALYQPVDFPEVSLTSNDGIDRIDPVDYQFTQSNGQAQRLAKQRLQRNQYQGRYSATGGPRWWQVTIGDVVRLSHQGMGWSNKLFRLVGQTISRTGETKIALLEENAAIYQWDNNEAAPVVAGVPTVYDPLNAPTILGIDAAGHSAAPGDSNRVRYSRFERDTLGWADYSFGGPTLSNFFKGVGAGSFAGLEYLRVDGAFTASGQTAVLLNDAVLSGRREFRIPVTPGERIFAGARIEVQVPSSSCTWLLVANWKDDANAPVGTATTVASGSGNVAFNTEVGGFADVPTGAVHASLELYVNSSVAGAFVLVLREPMVCGAGTLQTVRPPFSPGESNGLQDFATAYSIDVLGRYSFPYTYDFLQSYTSSNVVAYLRSQAGSAIATGLTWKYVVLAGTVNGHAAGATEYAMSVDGDAAYIPVTSLGANSNKVEVRAYLGDIMWPKQVELVKQFADPPAPTGGSGGGGGGGAGSLSLSTGISTTISGSSATSVGSVSGTTPTSATSVHINVNLDLQNLSSLKNATDVVTIQVQRLVGATWTNIGSSASGTCKIQNWNPIDGSVALSFDDTGLSSSTAYQWRVVAWVSSGSDSVAISGDMTVTA